MAIQTVRALVNGTWHTLTYNTSTGKYEATITAPGATSYHQPNGYYDVQVQAVNTAGTTATANGETLSGLRLQVRERVAPVITFVSPSPNAYVTNNKQPIVFTVVDEANGSGVDLDSIVIKIDSTSAPFTTTAITNGYSVTATPSTALSDGQHTVKIDAQDNDGNSAVQKNMTFTVDTVPPTLNITAPAEGLITATASLNVVGVTNDATSSPVVVTIKLNGTDQGSVTVATNGSFTKNITLREGSNTIEITTRDAAGKTSSVTRTVTLDTSVPKIVSATITPNPVNAGATMIISVEIEG